MKKPSSWRGIVFYCLLWTFCAGLNHAASAPPSWEYPPPQQREGMWWREHWYERGRTNHNPGYERRLRVNPPEIVLHPSFGRRVEARENGLMLIPAEEDLFQILGAELYLEMWGGHPGTANKRVTVNGRGTYSLPRVGTEEGHCTYSYPTVPLLRTDLVNGWNAFQLALEQGTTFWGHMMVDEACLRIALTNRHPDLANLNLVTFNPRVIVETERDRTRLGLDNLGENVSRIERVDYQAWYSGYDENGNQRDTDWHGFTQNRLPGAFAASSTSPPFAAEWDTSMLPAQKNAGVRAFVRLKDARGVVFVTAAQPGLTIPDRPKSSVGLYTSYDLPESFWSRAGNEKTCRIALDLDPGRIERAELHVVTWTGGAGRVRDYFKLNGRHFPVAEGTKHIPQYSRLPVDPSLLKKGDNRIELLSDTEHHGIEVLYPGPALMIRYRLPEADHR